MNFVLLKESIVVGIYTTIVALLLIYLFQSINKTKFHSSIWFFFILGFFKHFLGYFLNLQTIYCNEGQQCKKIHLHQNLILNSNVKAIQPSLLENTGEGIVFVIFGLILTQLFKIKNTLLNAFLIGFFLHIISDIVGLHTYFCKYFCA